MRLLLAQRREGDGFRDPCRGRTARPVVHTYIQTDMQGLPSVPRFFIFSAFPRSTRAFSFQMRWRASALATLHGRHQKQNAVFHWAWGVSLRPSIGGQHRGGTWEKQGRYQMGEYHHHRHTYIYLHVWCRVLGLSDELRACAGFGAGVLIGPRGSRHRQRCAGRLRPCQTPPAESITPGQGRQVVGARAASRLRQTDGQTDRQILPADISRPARQLSPPVRSWNMIRLISRAPISTPHILIFLTTASCNPPPSLTLIPLLLPHRLAPLSPALGNARPLVQLPVPLCRSRELLPPPL